MAATADLPASMQPDDLSIPPSIKQRLTRGREAMRRDAPKRRLCQRFERGDTYWFVNSKNGLTPQSTVTNPDGSGKQPHRIRNTYNIIRPIVQGKVSSATQRTPTYQVVPSTTDDQAKVSAASLSEKAARYGYDQWQVMAARQRCAHHAIGGGGEGFALPYFDSNVGPYVTVEDPETGLPVSIGQGEIKILALHGNQVFWEPGCLFDESRWYAIERAVPIDDITELPGFLGGEIAADANTSDLPDDRKPSAKMAIKTEYFERPCPNYPTGRYLVIANSRQVVAPGDYPLKNHKGDVLDEPVLHRLAWDIDGGIERDFGLTWQLIDSQRTVHDCLNKIIEWKNRALLPQLLSPLGVITHRRSDEPGANIEWDSRGGTMPAPEWEKVPEIPQSLFRVIDMVMQIMRLIASDDAAESQADYANVAAKTLQQVLEQSLSRWDAFRVHMAEFDSRLMRHCLLLCARYYTEPRLLKIKGRDGWERVEDFEGADLLGEVDCRVFSDSLVPQTRQGVQDMITWLNANFPGFLSPQDALTALQEGSLDRLTESYWLDKARANDVIQRIRDDTVMEMPTRGQTDPVTGEPIQDPRTGEPMGVPGYMPSQQDNIEIWEKVFADWMKTEDYARQPPQAQAQAQQVWDAIQALKRKQAVDQATMQTQLAQQLGMNNAAAPQGAKAVPSLPGSGTPPPGQ